MCACQSLLTVEASHALTWKASGRNRTSRGQVLAQDLAQGLARGDRAMFAIAAAQTSIAIDAQSVTERLGALFELVR